MAKLIIPLLGFLDWSIFEDINCLGCREMAKAGAMETVSGGVASAYQVSGYQIFTQTLLIFLLVCFSLF